MRTKDKNHSKVNRICKQCGGNFKVVPSEIKRGSGKFCSRKCFFEWRRGENHPNWNGGKIKKICPTCGKEFEIYLHKGHANIFCSFQCYRKGRNIPTQPELIFEQICKKNNLPFKYTGDGSFWIGKNPSVNPDFVECNGKKTAVEIFGDYWHSPLLNFELRGDKTLSYRKKILKEYGWKLIVFWETDLKRSDAEQFILNKLGELK